MQEYFNRFFIIVPISNIAEEGVLGIGRGLHSPSDLFLPELCSLITLFLLRGYVPPRGSVSSESAIFEEVYKFEYCQV